MKILHTESSCGWGGQELRVLNEAAGMRGRGHEVLIAAPVESRLHAEALHRAMPVRAAVDPMRVSWCTPVRIVKRDVLPVMGRPMMAVFI